MTLDHTRSTGQEQLFDPQSLDPKKRERGQSASEQFLAFFEDTFADVYTYLLHRTKIPELAHDLALDTYATLMKRNRLWWWKNILHLSSLFSTAETVARGVHRWQEDVHAHTYTEAIAHCLPADDAHRTEKADVLVHALKTVPASQQQVAVLSLLLHWPTDKIAAVLKKKKEMIAKECAAIRETVHQYGREGISMHEVLESVHCPPPPVEHAQNVRSSLTHRSVSPLATLERIAMPVASFAMVFSTFMGCVIVVSAFVISPLKNEQQVRQIALIETLTITKTQQYQEKIERIQHDLAGIAAHYATVEVAELNLALAGHAAAEQARNSQELQNILDALKQQRDAQAVLGGIQDVVALLE